MVLIKMLTYKSILLYEKNTINTNILFSQHTQAISYIKNFNKLLSN